MGHRKGRGTGRWNTGREGTMGHRKEEEMPGGTLERRELWDTGEEEGLPDGTQERKRDCQLSHRKGRGTVRWDTGREEVCQVG